MAAHAGIFFFDGRPIEARRGWRTVGPGVAMTQEIDDVWRENDVSAGGASSSAAFTVAWDGRLDNRDELLMRLGVAVPHGGGDASIALAAYARWEREGLRALVGDWSLAIWDRGHRRLSLARDYMGVRPLYYCVTPAFVAWSSSLGELVARCGRAEDVTDAFAARFLTLNLSPETTPYEGIRAVPPATCVSFTADDVERRQRFWHLEAGEIRYRNTRAYEEQLRHLWIDAVGARLRTEGTVWAELSGGLDSSSVVCMADWLIKAGRVAARAVRTISHATLHSPEGDERRFIAEVERQIGVESEIVGVEDHQGIADPEWGWVTPHALDGVGLACARRVRQQGGRVVLSGRMGDAVMGCQPDNSAAVWDDLAAGHPVAALRHMRAWSRATRKPFVEIAWRLLRPAPEKPPNTAADLLTPRLKGLIPPDTSRREVRCRRSQRGRARLILNYSLGAHFDIPCLPPGVVYTYPYAHRPLVEFMLAMPGEEWSAPGDMRSLMRRAFEGFVPRRVLARTSKGYYPPAAFRAVRQFVATVSNVEDLGVVQRGWIDPARLRESIRVLTDGGGGTGGDLYTLVRLEKWLRTRRERFRTSPREEVNSHAVLNA
jgi:asparagine synthase (glutamine-hydrolysing)